MLASSKLDSIYCVDDSGAMTTDFELPKEEWSGDESGGIAEFISVAEVYEIASAIGKEFEVIVDRHGGQAVCGLMPKVIHVLEELEEQATRRDGQLAEVTALRAAVERLEAEKVARAQQRLKDEQVSYF